ncbi:MAG: glyoxalase superfamily protein [Abditibacteriaceae bacterium]
MIPILRIFDEAKAREFYIDWLGFAVDWEHLFEENMPLYMQASRDGALLHLSEHHGDACPGAKIMIECNDIETYHQSLLAKKYKYNRPRLEKQEWKAITVTVHDPFGNKLEFFERIKD